MNKNIEEIAETINNMNYYETSQLIHNLSREKLSHLENGCKIKLKWDFIGHQQVADYLGFQCNHESLNSDRVSEHEAKWNEQKLNSFPVTKKGTNKEGG